MNTIKKWFSYCLCIRSQTENIDSMGYFRRWVIYIAGVLETLIFGGCVFGWAQLVYVLKNEGIFFDLCERQNGTDFPANSSGLNDVQRTLRGCEEQDKAYALIYTIACVSFGVPAFLMGMLLHYCGLATGRIAGSILLTVGFLALGCTTEEDTKWLYVAMICLALGGNQIRMAGFQLCNLFPNYRSTALTIISGSYAASAGLFMVFQLGQQSGMSLWSVSLILAGLASVSIPLTLLMPWHHIPYENAGTENDCGKPKIPIMNSVFCFSGFAQIFWQSINLIVFTSYAIIYNSWISDISKTNEEAGHYSLWYSLSCFFCPFVSPFPGLLMDYLARAPPGASEEDRLHRNLRSTIIPLAFVTVVSLVLRTSLFFNHPIAIYCTLVCMVLLRPSIFASGNSFIRIRFPPDHFDRIVGIQATVVCSFNALQYPLFIWTQNDFLVAMLFFLALLCLTFIHPLHLWPKWYLRKISNELLDKQPTERCPLIQER